MCSGRELGAVPRAEHSQGKAQFWFYLPAAAQECSAAPFSWAFLARSSEWAEITLIHNWPHEIFALPLSPCAELVLSQSWHLSDLFLSVYISVSPGWGGSWAVLSHSGVCPSDLLQLLLVPSSCRALGAGMEEEKRDNWRMGKPHLWGVRILGICGLPTQPLFL